MRLVLQRVSEASVSVAGKKVAEIGPGLIILLGVGPQDDQEQAAYLAQKTAQLRIFEDEAEKMNRSLIDTGGEAIVVSQFTLFADTRKGRRPSFTSAALPEVASPLVDHFVELLRQKGIPTQTGVFGEHMQVALINDGPVTIWIERD
ncbi:MAG: D-tyrosyl-tRNA(Tyr) deacylase [Anaerolineales bacterium]|nr:D-tyrosyl-tRNA(Tyr) deacylase [Anaerolineales bacterium]